MFSRPGRVSKCVLGLPRGSGQNGGQGHEGRSENGLTGETHSRIPPTAASSLRRSVPVVTSCGSRAHDSSFCWGQPGHVACRMCSLHPSGAGTGKNSEKRTYIGALCRRSNTASSASPAATRPGTSSAANCGRDASNTSSRPDRA